MTRVPDPLPASEEREGQRPGLAIGAVLIALLAAAIIASAPAFGQEQTARARDLGIVIGDKPDMIRVCEALGIPTYPLDHMGRVSAGESLLRVSCWAEIADVLFERERVGVEPTADV